jgi:hypothetical protein
MRRRSSSSNEDGTAWPQGELGRRRATSRLLRVPTRFGPPAHPYASVVAAALGCPMRLLHRSVAPHSLSTQHKISPSPIRRNVGTRRRMELDDAVIRTLALAVTGGRCDSPTRRHRVRLRNLNATESRDPLRVRSILRDEL